jgi:23S rRNA (adenine2503-C2)-methyltransferase
MDLTLPTLPRVKLSSFSRLLNFASVTEISTQPANLFGASHATLREFLRDAGAKPFAATQVSQWFYHKGVIDFGAMTNLSAELRAKLNTDAQAYMPEFSEPEIAEDGACKWEVLLHDKQRVESVFIPETRRGTLCISSQVGCVLNCSFCATGLQGFSRDLSAAEIIGQVWLAKRALNDFGSFPPAVTNVVFMGMGEPLLNFEQVARAATLMLDDNGFGMARRRVTISTAGVAPVMERVASEASAATLAVSLHAPNDSLRDVLVPLNKKYPIADVLEASKSYLSRLPTTGNTITFQYTLIDGVNDSLSLAHDLARLLRGIPSKINLIPFNPFDESDYVRPSRNRVIAFQNVLKAAGYITTVRTTRGNDIAAACGRLTGTVQDRSARTSAYKAQAQKKDIISCSNCS